MTNYSSLKKINFIANFKLILYLFVIIRAFVQLPMLFFKSTIMIDRADNSWTCTSFTRTYVFYSHARGCDRILLSGKNTTGNALSTPGASLITARYDNWGIKDRVICRSTIEWERRGMCFAQGRVFKGLWKRKFVKIFYARKFLIAHFICI